MGLVFRDTSSAVGFSKSKDIAQLTSSSVKFLRALGFKVVQDVGHRNKSRVQ